MSNAVKNGERVTFRVLGNRQRTFRGHVKDPNASLASVASRLARKGGLAGQFACLTKSGRTIDPQTRLGDLPDREILLASDLSPANRV